MKMEHQLRVPHAAYYRPGDNRVGKTIGAGLALGLCLGLGGCGHSTEAKAAKDGNHSKLTAVRVHETTPSRRTITQSISVPGIIQAYEDTAIYTKIPGYVLSWVVDLGDPVKKDQLMATLMVPELVEQHREKIAQLEQQRQAVDQAKQSVVIAERNLDVAVSAIAEAKAEVERYQAATTRWKAEYLRLAELAKEKAVDIRVVQEAEEHYHSQQSSERAAKVQVKTKETEQLASEAEVDKAKVDVMAAQAAVQVAEATAARYAALLAYTRVTAPYDGIVTARNVSVGDLVRPGTGDGSEDGGPLSDSSQAVPLFVVARMDKLMFVVGVPEMDAGFVDVGTPISIRVQASGIPEIETKVSRISWSVSAETRTLMAQTDLPNPKRQLMPGMYATGKLEVERRDVLAVPASAIVAKGNQATCFFVVDGRAAQQEIETGVSNSDWVQLLRKKVASAHDAAHWTDASLDDRVVFRDVSEVTDGASVEPIKDSGQGQDHSQASSSSP